MEIEIKFAGLTELLKNLEACASDEEIEKANREIVTRAAPIVQKTMKRHIPKSRDNSRSGRALKGGYSSRPANGHAADNVPIGKIKKTKDGISCEVGWELSDNSEYFYMKFVEWGTIYSPPRDFVHCTIDETDGDITQIAREVYGDLLASKIGG